MSVTLDNWIEADRRVYRVKQYTTPTGSVGIKDALEKGVTGIIRSVCPDHQEEIFYMLCFCLAVPQSKAIKAEEAISLLRGKKFFQYHLSLPTIVKAFTSRVRFQNRKAEYVYAARAAFVDGKLWNELLTAYECYANQQPGSDQQFAFLQGLRGLLIKKIKGMGMKEASHFLRNIGMSGLAILDVHIIKGLQRRGLIPEGKISLTKSRYCDIEGVMRDYAKQVGITLDELDLLLWSQRTGFVFK